MEAKATIRFSRISPQKARLVADLIRGKKVFEAMSLLTFSPKHAARIIKKLLKSAMANAEEKEAEDVNEMRINRITVDAGPTWKRFMPRARGRATRVRKRTSHISLVLADRPAQPADESGAGKENKKERG
jgi:large subunit ribosomal protein L22